MKLIRERLKRSLGKNKLKQWHVVRNEFYSITDNEQIDQVQPDHDDSEEGNETKLESQEYRQSETDVLNNESEEGEIIEEETPEEGSEGEERPQ